MARPFKITPEVEKRLLQLIQAGVPRKHAAQACGIAESTFHLRLANNRSFRSAVEKAYAECVAAKVLRIRKAEDDSWQAAGWWLERRERADFGRVDRVEQTGADGGPVQHEVKWNLDALPTHDLRELYRIQSEAIKHGSGEP